MRVVKGTSPTITSPTFVAVDEETPTDCGTLPTCTVTREDGTALTAAVVTNESAAGVYTAQITTTHTSQLDRLQIVWTGAVSTSTQVYRQQVEVVSAHYVSVPQIRAQSGLSDAVKFPTSLLTLVRDTLADIIDDYCRSPFVQRYEREEFYGDNSDRIYLAHTPVQSLLSVTVDGSSVSTAGFDVAEDGEVVYIDSTFPVSADGSRNVSIAYVYGNEGVPADLSIEAARWCRERVLKSVVTSPSQVISETQDGRTLRFSTPNPAQGRPTGSIDLDAILVRLANRIPGSA